MNRAYCLLRADPHYRKDAFMRGLAACGFSVTDQWPERGPHGDVLVIWNRYYEYDELATRFEKQGGRVLVAENGYFGNQVNGVYWYALALGYHNGAGIWPTTDLDGSTRRQLLGVEVLPWHANRRGDVLVLPQRGIGPPGVAMPLTWANDVLVRLRALTSRRVRVRPHPGQSRPDVSLQDDLANCALAITWGSGAALHALRLGVPVFYDMPHWIGQGAAMPLGRATGLDEPYTGSRDVMFENVACAMWRLDEIESGHGIRTVLACSP